MEGPYHENTYKQTHIFGTPQTNAIDLGSNIPLEGVNFLHTIYLYSEFFQRLMKENWLSERDRNRVIDDIYLHVDKCW